MIQRVLGTAVTALIVVAAVALAFWFLFAATTGATLITFRTGSMAPTMPQGTLAVSMPITASDIEVDDVITVNRSFDGQPVTHRVVEVRGPEAALSAEPLTAGQRELVLKGDDNTQVDGQLYVVSEARIVTFAFPGMGATLRIIQSPFGMGVLILLAGALTIWAFWPKRANDPDAADPDSADPGAAGLNSSAPDSAIADAGSHGDIDAADSTETAASTTAALTHVSL